MNFKFRLPKIKKILKRIRKVAKKTNVQKKRKKTSLKRIKKSHTPKQRLSKDEKEGMDWGKLATGVWKLTILYVHLVKRMPLFFNCVENSCQLD